MPTQTSERWISDGRNIKHILIDKGYKVDLQYAADEVDTQKSQIYSMIGKGVNVLVVTPIDAVSLSDTLDVANEKGIKVIAYDRLILDTDAVSYYASFDNYLVGVQQATALVTGLQERFDPPYNIELFAGSSDDTNTAYFFGGAMSVLSPLIDSGQVVVVSGQISLDQAATLRWEGATANARLLDILKVYYSDDTMIHGVLSPYDGISRGIISALKANGYRVEDGNFPIVTGQDAEISSLKIMRSGEQYATIFKDTRTLAAIAAGMVDAVLSGSKPEINDSSTYDNGVKIVDAYLCKSSIVYTDDIQSILIDSGYINEEDLK